MKKDILFANGCSFTWGGALEPWFKYVNGKPLGEIIGYDADDFRTPEGLTGEENTAVREQLVWPHHLGKHLKCSNVINLGMGCGSNQRIVRTTLEWLSSQDKETLDRTVAVIQMTEPSRYEYYEEEQDHWARCKVDICIQESEDWDFANARNMSRLSTFTQTEGIFEYVKDCLTIKQLMELYGVEYYMWTMVNPFYDSNEKFKKYNDLIDSSCAWINHAITDSTFSALERYKAPNGKITPAPSSIHPGVEGHVELAEILHFYIDAYS